MANEYLDLTGLTTYDTKLKTYLSTDYAAKGDLTSLYKIKGSVQKYSNLPASPTEGDVYNVIEAFEKDGKSYPAGTNVVWVITNDPSPGNGRWDALGGSTPMNAVDAAGMVSAPTSSNKNKVWKTDESGNPAWRDDADSTYSAGNGLSLSSGAFAAKPKTNGGIKVDGDGISLETGYTENGKNYKIQVDAGGKPFVNVPWTDNNTWTANSQAAAGYVAAGGANNNKVWKTDESGNPAWRDDDNTTYAPFAGSADGLVPSSGASSSKYLKGDGTWGTPADVDTKNTAGTTNKVGVKMFLVGAESQGANPQTFSNSNVYIDTNNKLCSNGNVVLDSSDLTPITELQIASLFE